MFPPPLPFDEYKARPGGCGLLLFMIASSIGVVAIIFALLIRMFK